jgi:S-methylmethionine-dependent homocysteine/selenocysteine methylase
MVLLDGATATELQRRGVRVRPPWWTTAALLSPRGRATLRDIHSDYVRAGARIVTANTFRCNRRALLAAGVDVADAGRLVSGAVRIARAATQGHRAEVAGSMAPVMDCYRPDLVPDNASLRQEHAWLARGLVTAGVDLILVETMNCLREARVATEQALAAGARVVVSMVAGASGSLLSGEDIGPAVTALARDGAEAVLVNCATPARTERCLRRMREVTSGPIGAYPNLEDRTGLAPATHVNRHLPAAVSPRAFAETVARWQDESALALVGCCCGSTPAHLRALAPVAPAREPESRHG